jgi:hypothetical protein
MKGFFLRIPGILILPSILCLGSVPANAQDANSDIYGNWRVTRDASPEGTITARNERQTKAVIGKVAVISADQFVFNGSKCSHPKYTRSSDDTATYFYREWRVNSDGMPLGERVTIIEVDCDLHFLYPIDSNRLIIADDGDFFEAFRINGGTVLKSEPAPFDKKLNKANADIFGTWTINGADWQGSGYDSTAMKQQKAGIYLGMPVYISANRFFYNENKCTQPTYKRTRQDKTAYFHGDWRARPGRLLFLPKVLTAVETECGTIYPISKNLIIIEDKRGMFYSAVPVSEKSAG